MKIQSLFFIVFLVCTSILSSCSTAVSIPELALQPTLPLPVPTDTSKPTLGPTILPIPTLEPTALPIPTLESTALPIPTLPPADITITFEEGSQCSYDGPQPIPEAESLTVNWYVNSTKASWYGLLAVIVGEGHTKADLIREAKSPLPPPDWGEHVGDFEAPPWSSMTGTIKASSGPLRGPLYFICWSGDVYSLKMFKTLGPFEVQ